MLRTKSSIKDEEDDAEDDEDKRHDVDGFVVWRLREDENDGR